MVARICSDPGVIVKFDLESKFTHISLSMQSQIVLPLRKVSLWKVLDEVFMLNGSLRAGNMTVYKLLTWLSNRGPELVWRCSQIDPCLRSYCLYNFQLNL